MKQIISTLLIAIYSLSCFAQCPTTGITDTYDMSLLNDFANSYPNCRKLPANLNLAGGNISDFPGFSQIDTIDGFVSCWECNIDSLVGWENLKYISGSLILNEPNNLTSLDGLEGLNYIGQNLIFECADDVLSTMGLENLTYVGGNIVFEENNDIVEIVGLENITHIRGKLVIESNEELTTIAGLSNLTHIDGNLVIDENPNLTSLEALTNLDSIGGFLEIRRNDGLQQIDNLDGLTSISGIGIYIERNPLLKNLSGLSSVSNFQGEIIVYGNDSLMNLNGLQQIPPTNINGLLLQDNPLLSFCNYQNICTYLSDQLGPYIIEGNFDGCNSPMEINQNCSLTSATQIDVNDRFTLFPNPFREQANLITKTPLKNAELHYISSDNKVLKSEYYVSGNIIPIAVDDLPGGMYLLMILQGQEIIGKIKFISIE